MSSSDGSANELRSESAFLIKIILNNFKKLGKNFENNE
jgi:hypothetical protein